MTFYARNEYTATAGQTVFAITFPFLDSSHVVVEINGTPITTFTVTSTTSLTLDSGATLNDAVVIKRVTPHTALVTFLSGSPITQEAMETHRKQGTYIHEEVADDFVAPTVAATHSPVGRYQMAASTALNVSVVTDDAETITVTSALELFGNDPALLSEGSDIFTLAAGLWKVRVTGQLLRTATTAGLVSVDWDMVDSDTNTRQNMSANLIYMNEPLGTAPDDQGTVTFSGDLFLDLAAPKNLKLRCTKTAGACATTLVNCYCTFERVAA
jgi:hypothetical protein